MAYWLVKSEPSSYAWEDLVRDGRTVWDGITNALALQNLRAARPRDQVLFYHTGGERRAMGIARVVRAPYPDPGRGDSRPAVIDLVPVKPLKTPVTPTIWRRLLTLAGER